MHKLRDKTTNVIYEKSTSKWLTIASISSSEKGGFASNEPPTGWNCRRGLKGDDIRMHPSIH